MSIENNTIHGICNLDGAVAPIYIVGKHLPLFRGSSHPDGHWETAPPHMRNQRCDPPDGFKSEYSVLYLAESEVTVEFELRRLTSVKTDRGEELGRSFQPGRQATLAVHLSKGPIAFVDVESPHLGSEYPSVNGGKDEIEKWRHLTQMVYRKLKAHVGDLAVPIVGVTYRSKSRGCNGRVFAMFAEFRDGALERGEPMPFTVDR